MQPSPPDPCPHRDIAPTPGQRSWQQINIELGQDAGPLRQATWPTLEFLSRALSRWRQHGEVACWFVRKAPGLRLRLCGPGYGEPERRALQHVMEREVARGHLVRWWTSAYEPETFRLGGPRALRAVHALFSAHTTVWLGWEHLAQTGQTRLSGELMALALYGDLLEQALPAQEEAWDVWCTLLQLYSGRLPAEPRTRPSAARLLAPKSLAQHASACERALLYQGFTDNGQFARALDSTWEQGELVGGPRALIATVASFHWNRWCLPQTTIARVCQAAVDGLHPAAAFVPRERPEMR